MQKAHIAQRENRAVMRTAVLLPHITTSSKPPQQCYSQLYLGNLHQSQGPGHQKDFVYGAEVVGGPWHTSGHDGLPRSGSQLIPWTASTMAWSPCASWSRVWRSCRGSPTSRVVRFVIPLSTSRSGMISAP